MKRGTTVSRYDERGQTLSRVLITRRYDLAHDDATCLGCGLCADVCPQGAVSLSPAETRDGRLARRAQPALLAEKCNFCGECVVTCPAHSLRLTIDGAARLPVVEGEAFPRLIAAVAVDVARCQPGCGLACAESCPVKALSVEYAPPKGSTPGMPSPGLEASAGEYAPPKGSTPGMPSSGLEALAGQNQPPEGSTPGPELPLAIHVDEGACFYCGKCEVACPAPGALRVRKPLEGALALDAALCPPGCRACADACPSEALAFFTAGNGPAKASTPGMASPGREALAEQNQPAEYAPPEGSTPGIDSPGLEASAGRGPVVDERNCFYCGACARACPVPGALAVRRDRVNHTPVKSAAWTAALGKILSPAAQARELESLARRRAREAALGLLGVK